MASNYSLFSLEDQQLAPKIIRTHAQVVGEIDMKPLLSVVEDIINRAKASLPHHKTINGAETPSQNLDGSGHRALEGIAVSAAHIALESPINYTSYMITWKCGGGEHEDSIAMELLQSVLSKYPWDAKVVIAYAAFAVAYGEFWLLQNPQSSRVAGQMASLMGFSDHTLDMEVQKAGLELLNLTMDLSKCVIELQGIPSKYTTLIQSDIPLTVYRIISSLVVCASLLTDASWNYRVSSIEAKQKITSLHKMLQPMLPKLEEQVEKCKSIQDEERRYMEFEKIVSAIHIDNMKILNAFFCEIKYKRLLYDGSTKKNERVDVLKRKHVLLLISDLEYPPEELRILRLIYNGHSMRREYEVLWLPVIDPTTELSQFQQDSRFYNLRNDMPWYSVEHHSAIEPVFIRYVREVLGFKHLPMLILLDPFGRLFLNDVLPMMWIWGERAFPFTGDRKRELLADAKWNIQLVAEAVDPRISEWIGANKVICLYGGEDVDWVRKFIHTVRTVMQALKVPMEILYVGKRNPKEKVRLCHEAITADNLSHIFAPDYYDFVWFFWVRLFSLWNCKKEMGAEDDDMMINIKHLLSYDSNDKGWALFGMGSNEITMARGDNVLPILESYNSWEKEVDRPEKFVAVLDKFFQDRKGDPHHCNRLILPSVAGVPETSIHCADCNKEMERYIMYRCCND